MGFWSRLLLAEIIPVLVTIYTVNFGRWLWEKEIRSGAIGAYLWAALCIIVPAGVLWYNR